MDEPMPNPQRYEAENDGRTASLGEDEWSTELEQLSAKLEADLRDITAGAIRDTATTVRALERRGIHLLRGIDERRRASEEEQQAMLARVSEMQSNIATLEQEIQEERRRAEQEAATTIDRANKRAQAILTQAETRAAEIAQEAEERRRSAEQEEQAVMARAAELRANIAAVEQEIEDERARAESEFESLLDDARVRSEAIIAEAEARAAEIVSSAHAELASRRGAPPARRSLASGTDAGAEDRLRGLSARVGQLLETGTPRPSQSAATPPSAPEPAPPPEDRYTPVDRYDEPADETPTRVIDLDSTPTVETEAVEDDEPIAAHAEPVYTRPSAVPSDDDEDDRPAAQAAPVDTDEADEDVEDSRPTAPHAVAPEPAPAPPLSSRPTPAPMSASGPVSQTVIFQSVPNFQAALALERSLKGMPDVREVRVADFDERQLTFQVTHELGDGLARVLLAQRGSELLLVDARADRIELAFRS